MQSATEQAVETYIRMASERDPDARAQMIEACWAEDGRLVAHGGGVLRGRDAMLAMFARVAADPTISRVRVLARDVRGTTFRFRYATDRTDGTSTEGLDAGEVDATGRISILFAFSGPLVDGAGLER